MNAGHAARTSSLRQPGKSLKPTGTNCGVLGTGRAGTAGAAAGGIIFGGVTGCRDTGAVQAASESATAASETSRLGRNENDMGRDMWVLMVEALVALFLLVFIVWWTMYADRPAETPSVPDSRHDIADDVTSPPAAATGPEQAQEK